MYSVQCTRRVGCVCVDMGHLWLSSTTPPIPAHPPPYMLIIVIEEIGYQRDQHHFHLVFQRCHWQLFKVWSNVQWDGIVAWFIVQLYPLEPPSSLICLFHLSLIRFIKDDVAHCIGLCIVIQFFLEWRTGSGGEVRIELFAFSYNPPEPPMQSSSGSARYALCKRCSAITWTVDYKKLYVQ